MRTFSISSRIAASPLLILLFVSSVGFAADSLTDAKWVEVRSPNFIVISNATEKQALEATVQLEEFRGVVQKAMPTFHLNSAEPTVVFAARDEATIAALLPEIWSGREAKPAGLFVRGWEQSHAVLRVDRGVESFEIIRHEYFHNLEDLNFVALPLWLNEGMAEFFGNVEIKKKEARLGMPSVRLAALRAGAPIPLKTLLTVNAASEYYTKQDKASMFYAQSWGLTHMLMLGPGMGNSEKLNAFIARLHRESDEVAAFEKVFGDLSLVEKQFAEYIGQIKMKVMIVRDPPHVDEKSLTTRTLSKGEAAVAIADFFRAKHNRNAALHYLEAAGLEQSDTAEVHRQKGFLAFDIGDDKMALSEFEKAGARDPADYLSRYYAAMLRYGAEKTEASSQALLAALKQVQEMNPAFAPVYIELSKAYLKVGSMAEADSAARRASDLEPGRAGYYAHWAKIKLAMGKYKEAADLARYVAERWYATDRDQAIEIWGQVAEKDEKVRARPLSVKSDAPEGASAIGVVTAVRCNPGMGPAFELQTGEQKLRLVLAAGRNIKIGFDDTLWYGSDHFNICHHLVGQRMAVVYEPSGPEQRALVQLRVEDERP